MKLSLKTLRPCIRLLLLAAAVQCPARPAAAADDGAAGVPDEQLTPPTLTRNVPAEYPAEALAARVRATVSVELTVDESGRVTAAKLTAPAGRSFDEAALRAARQLEFEPARRNGRAIPATVEFSFDFAPPSAPASDTVDAPPPETKEVEQSGPRTLVIADRPELSASAFTVSSRELELRPRSTAGDLLRATPGLVVVQHSGGGKANQYFLRGFDADHGTDVALSLDGVPINLVSHAHGQGYADTSFIIPELVERIDIKKGPYFTQLGDFATAGAIDFVSKTRGERTSLGLGFETSPGHGSPGYRTLLIASPKLGNTDALFAADIGRANGPFEQPNQWDKYRVFNKLSYRPSSDTSLSATFLSYAGNWRGSGQLPARAVSEGSVSRFGALDPSEGGGSARHQVALSYRARGAGGSELTALAYLARYRLRLFSNFTYFLSDAELGDEIEQDDARSLYGAKLSYRVPHRIGDIGLVTTLGAEARNDDVHGELWNAAARQRTQALKSHDLSESAFGAYLDEQVTPARWLRFDLGVRADLLAFTVDDRLAPTTGGSGAGSARQLSPKGSAIIELLNREENSLHLFGNYGHGFHSNDVRGAFASPRVSPLSRAVGAEVGARARLFRRWRVAAAAFRLDLASETVWLGDEGTTESAGATTRRGLELENRLDLTNFLSADLDLTFTKSEFRANAGNGNGLALAPKQTWSGGLSAHGELGPGKARAALRFFGVGERPATDDGALVVPGYTQLDLALGYALPRLDVALDVENLLNSSIRSAAFATITRLRGEPGVGSSVPAGFGCGSNARLAASPTGANDGRFYGCEDLAFTPANPLTLRVMATLFLD